MKKFTLYFLLAVIVLTGNGIVFGYELEAKDSKSEEPSKQSIDWIDETGKLTDRLTKPLQNVTRPFPVYNEQTKLRFGGEYRYRLELRDHFTFNQRTVDNGAINMMRSRFNAELTLGPLFKAFAMGQDSESFSSSPVNRSFLYVNKLDLHELYGELKSPWEEIPLAVKVGRQKLYYGDERFVGAFEWSNVARVFDAVKVMATPFAWFNVDMFFSQVVRINRVRPDTANHRDNFYGIYSTLKPNDKILLDTFLFIRHNRNDVRGELPGQSGQLKEYTFGNRLKGNIKNWDYGLEWAGQAGSRAHDEIQAWALHVETGYAFTALPWDPRLNFEYNHGSGDSNPRDGKIENFDNLFPTNHKFYGYMDLFSLKNLNDFKVGVDAKPHERIKLSVDYHWFFLDTNASAWFNAGQAVVRGPRVGASTTVGQELDLLLKWYISKHVDIWIGYSHFHSGAFVKDTGTPSNPDFFYTQTTFRF